MELAFKLVNDVDNDVGTNITGIDVQEVKTMQTTEYGGITYFIYKDLSTSRYFIYDNGERLYLDKNMKVQAKQPGKFSTVDFLTRDEVERMEKIFCQRIREASTPTNELIAWRDRTLFFAGINVGLRASDLRMLRWNDIFDEHGERKRGYVFRAKKTKKRTEIGFNQAFYEAIELYRKHLIALKGEPKSNDFLFFGKKDDTKPIIESTMWAIMHNTAQEAGIEKQIGSHTLRKTFGRNAYLMSKDKTARLIQLQTWFQHSSPSVTLRYIGITFDEMQELADEVNLMPTIDLE